MTLLEFANKKLAIETIIAQLGILAAIVYVLFLRKQFPKIGAFLGRYGLLFAFLTALGATAGSLFYSNVAGFAPCELCWFQRIFMYPLVIILGNCFRKNNQYTMTARIPSWAIIVSMANFLLANSSSVILNKA